MAPKPRSFKFEKLARIYDDEVLPVWSQRFGKMLLRGLELPERCQVLDVACGTGYPAVEVVRRLGGGGRLIAIDASSAMLDVARKKFQEMGAKGVFFRTESAEPKLSFAADVYDLVICNLGLGEMEHPVRALTDFTRVTKPGGEVRCTLPIEGTFEEFFDIYREVLTKHDKHETLAKLAEHVAASYPTVTDCETWLRAAGLRDIAVDVERFTLLFRSSREFFFAPVIEFGPLPVWKGLAGKGQEMQDVFWYIKEAIDAYFDGRAFEITVVAACLRGVKRDPADSGSLPASSSGEIEVGADDIDGEESLDTTDPHATRAPTDLGIGAVGGADDADEEEGEPEEPDPGLDAFVEGKPRPTHLDDDE